MRICIVVPVYNEEKIIKGNIETIISYAVKLPVCVTTVAVNDGSVDLSGKILKELKSVYPLSVFEVIEHTKNKGYGAAQRTGIDFAVKGAFDYIIFMDSDLTNHPKYLIDFYNKILEGYDYIKATRYGLGSGISGVPFSRRIISICGNKIAGLLFGLPLRDLTNGFRAVRADILGKIKLTENGFAVIMEELFLSRPWVRFYAQVPYVLTSRTKDHGNSRFTYDFRIYFTYLKYGLKSVCKKSHCLIRKEK